MGHKFEGGETKNTLAKHISKGNCESPCRPCSSVGTAEFSFFVRTERTHTRLWTHPQLHCDLFVTRVGRAQPLCPLTHPQQGKFWRRPSQIQQRRTQSESCRLRCATVAPFRDCATVVCVTKCKIKEKKIKKKETK